MKTLRLSLLGVATFVVAVAPARPDHPTPDQLGTIRFEVSGRPEARERVLRGVKLLHHMMYVEADAEFAAAAVADPDCALAWWGRAMTLVHPLWSDAPSASDYQRGTIFVQRGLGVPRLKPRERGYLEVLRDLYDGPERDYPTRLREADVAWTQLAQRHPDDLDALAFAALYHLAPARFAAKDRSNRLQLEAAQWLQEILAKIPDHPGAQHYKIHAFDFPLLAGRALEVCDSYVGMAPEVPHALHMPTHIYTRRGLWDESIEFNRRSAEAARKLAAAAGEMNSHLPHAYDYLAYAYLQSGRYGQAARIRDELPQLRGPYAAGQLGQIAFAFSAVPARCALERQAWAEAANLPLHEPAGFPWSPSFLHCDSIVHFARALGAARSGQLEDALKHIDRLEEVRATLAQRKGPPYWEAQAEAQALGARAWVRLGERAPDEAVALLRRAVEIEATTDKEAVTPGEVLPAGELLGDLLLEIGRPADALAAYEAVLAASPNRLNALYGAGLAAERAGALAKAREHFAQLAKTAAGADSGIARVEHARAFLAKNPAVAAR